MKIRTGFVSNSSSSSFIVILPKHLGNAEAMGKELFKGDWDPKAIVTQYDYTATQKEVAERVYDDYCKHKKKPAEQRRDELIEQFYSLSCDRWHAWDDNSFIQLITSNCPESLREAIREEHEASEKLRPLYQKKSKDRTKEEQKLFKELVAKESAAREKDHNLRQEWATKMADSYLKKYQEYTILNVEYSDNSGSFETLMEHGDIFQALVHERISHH